MENGQKGIDEKRGRKGNEKTGKGEIRKGEDLKLETEKTIGT